FSYGSDGNLILMHHEAESYMRLGDFKNAERILSDAIKILKNDAYPGIRMRNNDLRYLYIKALYKTGKKAEIPAVISDCLENRQQYRYDPQYASMLLRKNAPQMSAKDQSSAFCAADIYSRIAVSFADAGASDETFKYLSMAKQ